nr:HAD family hydrolase [Clostridia bacterium]
MKYDTALFDLDGTLFDTLPDLVISMNNALRRHGLPERSFEQLYKLIGCGARDFVALSIDDDELREKLTDTVVDDFLDDNNRNLEHTIPYPGICELISKLYDAGIKIGVVSNKFHETSVILISQYFGDMVKVVIGNSGEFPKKPAPDAVFHALEILGSSPEHAVYIGDTEVDAATADNSGLDCIAVTWGYRPRETVVSLGAKYLADTAEDVAAVFGL